MPETLIAIPLYDPVIMGNPLYIWLLMVMGTIIAFAALAMYYYVYEPMKDVWGFRTASIHNIPQAIINGMNGKIWIEPIEYVANIFSSMNLPLRWITTVPVLGQIGKVNTVYLSDDWNITHNLDIDYAIVYSAEKWNKKAEEENITIETEGPNGEITKSLDTIYGWETYERHLMNGDLDRLFPQGIKLPPFRVVNLNDVRRYLPKWDPAHHSGFINAKVAERMTEGEKDATKIAKILVIAGIFFIICCVFGYVILHGV